MVDELRMRHVALEGPLNFRDLGGYRGSLGRLRWGRIFRSDALCDLSENDVSRLVNERGLQTVVDLRRADELVDRPNTFHGHERVAYFHAPVVGRERGTADPVEYLRSLDFAAHYLDMLRRAGPSFALIFRLLADDARYPIVFHCTAGRDRTGVAAALVLLAAGVGHEEIVADYLLSAERLLQLLESWRARTLARGIDPEPLIEDVQPRPAYLLPVLDTVEREFGGIEGYLAAIGVPRTSLEAFRRLALEPDPEGSG